MNGRYSMLRMIMGLALCAFVCTAGPAFAADDDTQNTESIDHGIPVVTLDIDESRGSIDAMNQSPDHSVYCYGTLSIDVPDVPGGFHYSDMPDAECQSVSGLSMSIRGRGNSTWSKAKKPYKIKLNDRADLFGLGENKHWVLIANAYDPTLMRDRITSWLGEQMGFEFTPRGVPVDLVMNGDYLGSYYFSENVRVDTNRLEIDKLTGSDTGESEITGGYLLQNGSQTDAGSPDLFYTKQDEPWATHTPSFDTSDGGYECDAQRQYIQGYIQDVEDALYSDAFTNEKGQHYRDLMDLPSAAKYWLIDQASLNGDGYGTGSTYIYKKRGSDRLYWGPLWDFDFAWDYVELEDDFKIQHSWVKAMLYDTEADGFAEEVEANWPQLKAALQELTKEGGIIDGYYEETRLSAEADRIVNPPEKGASEEGGAEPADFDESVAGLKSWIDQRTAWMDANISRVGTGIMHKLTFMNGETLHDFVYVQDGQLIAFPEEFPSKEGHTFVEWTTADGQSVDIMQNVHEDQTFYASFLPDAEVTHAKDILFPADEMTVERSDIYGKYQILYTVVPEDAQDNAVAWSSSDESIATVDSRGQVRVKRCGTVTFTGTLKSGTKRTFTLTVTDEPIPYATDIRPLKSVIDLAPGAYGQIRFTTIPAGAKYDYCSYTSDNEDVVIVNENGALLASGPGRTTVHISVSSYDPDKEETIEARKTVTVNVSGGPQPAPAKVSIQGAKVLLSATAFTYNGKVRKPSVRTIGGRQLTAGKDYTLTIRNSKGTVVTSPKNAGSYTMVFTGKGSYTGTTKAVYRINKAANLLKVKGRKATVKYRKLKKKKQKLAVKKVIRVVRKGQGKLTYKKVSGNKKITISKKTGKVTVKKKLKKGTYKVKVRVRAAGSANYRPSAWKTVTIRIKVK